MIISPQRNSQRPSRQAGNILFAVFGAVAVTAILSAALITVVRGPISTSVGLTRDNIASNQMVIGTQAALMNAVNQGAGGDCDNDGFVEPIEWRSPAALVPIPIGGGLIPSSIAAPKRDPWGTDYGYCVWDHGPKIDDAACGGAAQKRLQGTNNPAYPTIAIISAGKNGAFETTCKDFSVADANGDGDLADPGDTSLIVTAGLSDDIVQPYTYEEAVVASGDLWSLKSSDSNTATIAKDLEVAGNANFGGASSFFNMIGDSIAGKTSDFVTAPGLKLPDKASFNPTCTAALSGVLRSNRSADISGCSSGGGSTPPTMGASLFATSIGSDPSVTSLTTASFDSTGYEGIAVFAKHEGAVTSISITDNKGTAFSSLTKETHGNNDLHGQLFWGSLSNAGSGHTVTISFGASRPYVDLAVWLLNADGGVVQLDTETTAQGNGNTQDAGTLTTTAAATLVMGVGGYTPQTYTAGSGWVEDNDTYSNMKQHRSESAAGTFDPVATSTGSNDWVAVAAAFKAVSPSSNTISLVQKSTTTEVFAATNNDTASFATLPVAGNTVFVAVSGWIGGGFGMSPGSVTDNQGNTYTLVKSGPTGQNGQVYLWAAYNIGTPTGTFTVNIHPDGAGWGAWGLMEVSGIKDYNLDGSGEASVNSGTSTTVSTSAPTTGSNDFAIGVFGFFDAGCCAIVPEAGWTQHFLNNEAGTYEGFSTVTKTIAAPGTVSHTWTHSTAANNGDRPNALIVAYKPESSGTSTSAPVFESVTTGAGAGGSLTVSKPAGTAVGDLLLFGVSGDNGQTMDSNWPNGFIALGPAVQVSASDGQGWKVGYKIVDGTEPASFTFSSGIGNSGTAGVIARYSNVDPVNPIDFTIEKHTDYATSTNSWPVNGTNVIAKTNTRIGWFGFTDSGISTSGLSFTPPAGFTERADLAGGTQWTYMTFADKAISSGGAQSLAGAATDSVNSMSSMTTGAISVGINGPLSGGGGGGSGSGITPVFQSVTTGSGSSNATMVKPPGTVAGDLIVLGVAQDDTVPLTWPAGFTQIARTVAASPDGQSWAAAYKIMDGSEGASFTVGSTTSYGVVGFAARYTEVDPINPIEDPQKADALLGASPWTVSAPSVSPTGINSRLVWIASMDANNFNSSTHNYTVPSGFTERVDMNNADWVSLAMGDKEQLASGPSGPLTGSAVDDSSVSAVRVGAIAFALVGVGSSTCPAGYTRANGRCYKVDAGGRTWDQARALCQADGGDLLVINTKEEHDYIKSLGYFKSWIGYTDVAAEGTWAWISPSTYTQDYNRMCGEDFENSGVNIYFDPPGNETVTSVDFASYGTPSGVCGAYVQEACHSANSVSTVQADCVGQTFCAIVANNGHFGGDPCINTAKILSVQVRHSGTVWSSGEPNQGAAANCAVIQQNSTPGYNFQDEPCSSTAASTICEIDPAAAGGGAGGTCEGLLEMCDGGTGATAAGIVQSTGWAQDGSGVSVTSLSSSFGSSPTAGNTVLVFATFDEVDTNTNILPYGSSAVTDNQGNTYNLIASENSTYSANPFIYAANNVSSSGTFTITVNTHGDPGSIKFTALELSGLTASPLDRTGNASNHFTNNLTVSTSSPTTQNNEIALAFITRNFDPTAYTTSPGWTTVSDSYLGGYPAVSINRLDLISTGTPSITYTQGSSDDMAAAIITLKAGAGSGGSNSWIAVGGSSGNGAASNAQPFADDTTMVCNAANKGKVRYYTTLNRPEFCDGTSWRPFVFRPAGVQLVADPMFLTDMDVDANGGGGNYGATRTFTITNKGDEASGSLNFALQGAQAGNFDYLGLLGSSTCDDVLTLAPGASCTLLVAPFANSNGNPRATLHISDAGPSGAFVDVMLSGHNTGFDACTPGKKGFGGIILTCPGGTAEYIIQEPGCGQTTSNPTCTGLTANDPVFNMDDGVTGVQTLRQDMVKDSRGDINMLSLLGYGSTAPAALYCSNLVISGYSDWYLPSTSEALSLIQPNWKAVGMDENGRYYSSTYAYTDYFASYQESYTKTTAGTDGNHPTVTYPVRCIRRNSGIPYATDYPTDDTLFVDSYYRLPPFSPGYTSTPGAVVTSSTLYIRGINKPLTVTLGSAGSPQLRINGGAWVSSGTINPKDTLQLRATSGMTVPSELNVRYFINGRPYSWRVRTTAVAAVKVFVTSATYNGNLGGWAGAKTKCQTAGSGGSQTSYSAGKNYYPILGGTGAFADSMIPWNFSSVTLTNPTTAVATNLTDLLDGTVLTAVRRDENGTARTGNVWTGLLQTDEGFPVPYSTPEYVCRNWTSSSGLDSGYTGDMTTTNYNWLSNNSYITCNTARRLYCIGPF